MPPYVQRFARNTKGRDIIVGDIHGNYTKLKQSLKAIGFNFVHDRLFCVGDLCGRGPESIHALDWLNEPWFHAVAGNHETMVIDYHNGFGDRLDMIANGEAWVVALDRETRAEVVAAFSAMPIVIELETEQGTVGIVHAECAYNSWQELITQLEDPNIDERKLDQLIMSTQWLRSRIEHRHNLPTIGIRAVVVGHTPRPGITRLGSHIYIDTGGWHPEGHYTLLDAATLEPVHGS